VGYFLEYFINPQQKKSSKITLGYLDNNEYLEHNSKIVAGIFEAARKFDINLIRFGYYTSNSSQKNNKQIEMILELIKQHNIHGLMFLGWTEAAALYNKDFISKFSAIPILSIGTFFKDIPNVFFPGHIYIKEILLHLINEHKFKKIAYLAPDRADERNDTYINTMKEYGIYNPDLYISENELADMSRTLRAKRAAEILFDEKKVSVEAIVTLYKWETALLIDELTSRGINVPKDIAVTSYEDDDNGRFSTPSYTSVYFPWMEMGFYGCEKMYELVTNGHIPISTEVPGKVIYRNSCGCLNKFDYSEIAGKLELTNKKLNSISVSERKTIVFDLESRFRYINFDFEKLLNAFIQDFESRTYKYFIEELVLQLKCVLHGHKYSDIENIVSVFRKFVMPYIIDIESALVWAGNLFQISQIVLREKIADMRGHAEVKSKNQNQVLEEISQELVANFSLQNILGLLKKNLLKLEIPVCHLFLFDTAISTSETGHIFDNCFLAFGYDNYEHVNSSNLNPMPVKKILSDILYSRKRTFLIFAHLLHVNNDYMGFILFEPGPVDERVYQVLAAQISTALRGALLLEKLEKSYKKLVEQAHKEGMADIAAGILHNIGNAFSSVNSSVQIMRDLVNKSPVNDLKKANELLEKNIEDIEDFISNNVKGKKLMHFYLKLGLSIKEFRNQMLYHINRLDEKIYSIDDMITAQQSYAGVESIPEKFDLANVLEDVLKVNSEFLDKSNIKVVKKYLDMPQAVIHKGKLFHILTNIIKNAREAMSETKQDSRRLVITLSEDDKGKYIRIADSGCGIPESIIERIFTYGFTTKKEGQGFGLYSCENYMAEMGGEIWAESEGPGMGAEFILHF